MHLILGFGPAYLLPARVFLQSVERHCTSPHRITLLHLEEDDRCFSPLADRFPVTLARVPHSFLNELPRKAQLVPEACLPLVAADLLTGESRGIYLDADMLCVDDMLPLWNQPLNGLPLGAVTDMAIPTFASPRGVGDWRELGRPPDSPYFNAGMMLMDLELWRSRNLRAMAVRHMCQHRVDFLHQEALNVVLHGQWVGLDPRWNVIAGLCHRRFSRKTVPGHAQATQAPALIHFAGFFKPWRIHTQGPFGREYRRNLPSALSPSLKERCWGFYDRVLRDGLYPFERWAWKRKTSWRP